MSALLYSREMPGMSFLCIKTLIIEEKGTSWQKPTMAYKGHYALFHNTFRIIKYVFQIINIFTDCQTDVIGFFEGCSYHGSHLLGNISLSVLRSQSDCAEAVLGESVQSFSVLVDVPVEHSMNGRSSSESSSITLDNFSLLIRLTCTCSSMYVLLIIFSLERFDSAKPGV